MDRALARPANEICGDESAGDADHAADPDGRDERGRRLRPPDAALHRAERQREEHEARAVVEQAFPFNESPQSPGNVEAPHGRDDGDRIGRRGDRSDDERKIEG